MWASVFTLKFISRFIFQWLGLSNIFDESSIYYPRLKRYHKGHN